MKKKIYQKVQVILGHPQGNRQWKILLLQTNKQRGLFWQNITGGVEEGESLEQAAKREVQEETGQRVDNLYPLDPIFEFTDRWGKEVQEYTFLAVIKNPTEIVLSGEHQNYKWPSSELIDEHSYRYPSNYQTFLASRSLLFQVK